MRGRLIDGLYLTCPGCGGKLPEPHPPAESAYLVFRMHYAPRCRCRIGAVIEPDGSCRAEVVPDDRRFEDMIGEKRAA